MPIESIFPENLDSSKLIFVKELKEYDKTGMIALYRRDPEQDI